MSDFFVKARQWALSLRKSNPVLSARGWLGFRGLITFTSIYSLVVYLFKYRKFNAIPALKKGFEEHRIQPNDAAYMDIFKRLIGAYNKAKSFQSGVEKPYKVGYIWQEVLDNCFVELAISLRSGDIGKLQPLLENFDRESFSFQLGGSTDFHAMSKNPLYKYQFVNTWYKCLELYKEVVDEPHQLTYPLTGNTAGLYYNGQVIPIDAIRYHYYSSQVLSLLRDVKNPVICEIGAGLGGQAYKVVSNADHHITYIVMDIPEVLVLSSYFLMASLPNKKFLLYGEAPLECGKLGDYDVIMMPNYMLPQLEDGTVDLFYNAASFSEMDNTTVEEYIQQIGRICRKYLLHVNHNQQFTWEHQGRAGANLPSTSVKPDPRLFKRLYKFVDSFILTREEDKIVYSYFYNDAKYFVSLYEKLKMKEAGKE